MNSEKEIEKMGKAMCEEFRSDHCGNDCECANEFIAEKLINAGYGNVKQAVKEFAEKLKSNSKRFGNIDGDNYYVWFESELDKLFNELYGADE
jgi:hypothetical protein